VRLRGVLASEPGEHFPHLGMIRGGGELGLMMEVSNGGEMVSHGCGLQIVLNVGKVEHDQSGRDCFAPEIYSIIDHRRDVDPLGLAPTLKPSPVGFVPLSGPLTFRMTGEVIEGVG